MFVLFERSFDSGFASAQDQFERAAFAAFRSLRSLRHRADAGYLLSSNAPTVSFPLDSPPRAR